MQAKADMRGKAALVTGAGGAIGRATALRLAQLGADLCLVDGEAAGLAATAQAARAAGVRAEVHAIDITSAESCAAVVAAAVAAFGRLDGLCNVANAFLPARAGNMPIADFDLTLAINLAAPFYFFQAAIPHLLEARGAVVNVTSCVAFIAQPYTAAYAASKAGATHMTRALAMEYMDAPVRINAVAPGAVAIAAAPGTRLPPDVDPKSLQLGSPARGTISVDEVADLIAFLLTDDAHGYHGACISLDKGISLG
ncbi:SDR family NAD(P)-dependent oxidoreductase [Phenylobacterium sp. LjRoot219]|uniref:SDR family NAD(P)-dependent oxidoreductase n=1 Tax=Phenylobacterium sp. LjRoot219 TaxID=3342283 RepID=UPI003ECF211C